MHKPNPQKTNSSASRQPGSLFYLFACTLIAALGGLLFGFDTAVISGAEQTLQQLYGLTGFWHGLLMATALIGTIVGAVLVGKPADMLGRRTTLMIIALFYLISAIGSAFAWGPWSFGIFRFLGGLAVGGASVVSPMYTAEISTAKLRGRLVALTQFNICLGIMLAYVSNYAIAEIGLGASEWRWMFGVEAVPAAVFALLLFLTPRSPRWLMAKNKETEARHVIRSLTRSTEEEIDAELQAIRNSLDIQHHSLKERFFQRSYMKPILLVIAMASFNQLSGINALLYYAPRVFEMSGAVTATAKLSSITVGFILMVCTMGALCVIDNFGRRWLMILGSVGYIVSLAAVTWVFFSHASQFEVIARENELARTQARVEAVLAENETQNAAAGGAIESARQSLREAQAELSRAQKDAGPFDREDIAVASWVVLIGLLLFIASHAIGQGTVIWVFISEIFPNRLRARGQALGSFTHWFWAAVITWTFPAFAVASGALPFAFFTICMVAQLIWVLRYMPETKGIPLEEIQKRLGID
ncbi:sugar porter family MFS transporter [Bremerella sp. JC770]|uniref:sugar porter family MFS transporter n=1 Tax=Bremerella sp. JC770 TaxID=3232137 RepID=UPI003457A82F